MRIFFFIALVLFAFLERVIFDLGPNVELVTMAMLLASFYLGRRWALWVVFLVMVLSDTILGNTNIFLFTWSGFLIPAVVASGVFGRRKNPGGAKRVVLATGVGVGATLFFYSWTNFGVWLLDSWGMYSRDFSGLLLSYINGLPFLRMQMASTLLFVPVGFVVVEFLRMFVGSRIWRTFSNRQSIRKLAIVRLTTILTS